MEEKEQLQAEEAVTHTLPPKITKESIDKLEGTKKQRVMRWVKCILLTIFSSLLISFAAYALIAPNEFTIGGIAGIAILLNVASNNQIPQSVVLFSINLPLIILAFFFVKRRFAILSALNICLQSLWLLIIEMVFQNSIKIVFPGGDAAKIFAAIAAGICIGTAIVLAFKAGGSTGGADILAVMIQKKIPAGSIAWILFGINCFVIGASIFVFQPDAATLAGLKELGATKAGVMLLPIALSAFEAFIESKTNESLTNGFQSAIEFRIITDKPTEMATALMTELSRGVTAIPATGMYTKVSHTMLLCVISRRQVPTVQRIMKSVDPDSFAVTSKVSQVLGLGFYRSEL